VSVATVSRALNDHPGISAKVRQQVIEVARLRGYIPNGIARNLRLAGSGSLGFLVGNIQSFVYSIAASACGDLLGERGYQLMLGITNDDPEKELRQLRALVSAQVEGLVIVPSLGMLDESRTLIGSVPAVEFYRSIGSTPSGVFVDEATGIGSAVDHLVELGHSKVALITITPEFSNARSRREGFVAACARHGLDVRPEWIVDHGLPRRATGYEAVFQLLDLAEPPTAIIAGGNELSIGVAQALADRRVSIPRDLSVVVYGEPDWTGLYATPLTTVAVPYANMARAVAEMMTGHLSGERELNEEPVLFGTELMVRDSTAPPGKETSPCA
jgi:LacI family transcriptional regulator